MSRTFSKKTVFSLNHSELIVEVTDEMDLITISDPISENWIELSFDEMVTIYKIFEQLIESTNWKK